MPNRSDALTIDEPRLVAAQRTFALINREIELVETEFERQAKSNIQIVSYMGEYLRASGGKRVRPALLLLAAYATGGDGSRHNVVRMATVMEFLHTATLVHDDIIDNAEMRRGYDSVNARFGNQKAVLMGDWLYMSAFETSLAERSLGVLDILTKVTRKMVEGELMQLTEIGNIETTEQQYFDILERKTAYLFSACCEIGAMLGAGREGTPEQEALREYGMHLGRAFQLTDDLLDFTQSDDDLGKPAGADLREGKMTLPLIYLLEVEPDLRETVQDVMRSNGYAAISRRELGEIAERTGAIERARVRADKLAEAAHDALQILPHSKYRSALESMPNYIINRES